MKRSILFLILVACGFTSQAQNSTITVSYDSIPFTELVRDIESKTPYRFFYSNAWVDTLVVTGSFTNVTPFTIVKEVLQNTSIHYYTIANRIILTHNTPILNKIDTTLFVEFQHQDASSLNYTFQRELIPEEKGG